MDISITLNFRFYSVRPGSNGGVEQTLPSEVVQKLLTANQPEFGTESTMFKTNEYYSGDPPMSQIDSAFTQAPHKSLVRSSSQESFGSNSTRLDLATSSSDWIGQGAIPKSGGRQSRKGQKFIQCKVQEFQSGKVLQFSYMHPRFYQILELQRC